MVYDAIQKRWVGNEDAVAGFDRAAEPTRMGLISNLGRANVPQVVGEMVYDPEQMVWLGNEADAARFPDVAIPRTADALRPGTVALGWMAGTPRRLCARVSRHPGDTGRVGGEEQACAMHLSSTRRWSGACATRKRRTMTACRRGRVGAGTATTTCC